MKKKIIYFLTLIVIALLSYKIDWFNYLLFLTIALSLIFLVLIGLLSIFKKLKKRTFLIPLLIIFSCVIGIIVGFFRPYDKPVINSNKSSKKLEYAYKTDQNDRKEIRSYINYFSKLKERDSKRLKQTKDLYPENKIIKPIDKFHAAFIFHHSDNSKDYKIASELAADAANSKKLEDNYTVQWLKKASYDRYMLSIGKPEKYNTQNKFSLDVN